MKTATASVCAFLRPGAFVAIAPLFAPVAQAAFVYTNEVHNGSTVMVE